MKYATRINSVLRDGVRLDDALAAIAEQGVIEWVDLNYPEHVNEENADEVTARLDELGLRVNSIAMRFRSPYIGGEFTNPDERIRAEAIELCKRAADLCRTIGAGILTVWLGYDGFDYCFQKDYAAAFDLQIKAFQEICDHAPELAVSIEYKPYEERTYAMIPNAGITLHTIDRVQRDNIGLTLDFCHQLMAGEMPAHAAALALAQHRLLGIHLNDGNGRVDDGLMVAAIHPWETMELLYYLAKHHYDGVIYFDTFPIRESAIDEMRMNVATVETLLARIREFGLARIQEVVESENALASQRMRVEILGGSAR